MYRSLSLALAAALMAPLSQAMAEVHIDSRCEVNSPYNLKVEPSRLVFSKEGAVIAFAQGQLYLDGKLIDLSSADSDRVAAFEQDARALIPELKAVAHEAIELAFVALHRVIDTFATDSNKASFNAELEAMRNEIASAVTRAESTSEFENGDFETKISEFATRMAPRVAGELASQAIAAAMSGDGTTANAIEAKAKRLERDIEASVEAPAKALEARVDALCPRVQALDRLDNQLELRLPNGEPLNLLRVKYKA